MRRRGESRSHWQVGRRGNRPNPGNHSTEISFFPVEARTLGHPLWWGGWTSNRAQDGWLPGRHRAALATQKSRQVGGLKAPVTAQPQGMSVRGRQRLWATAENKAGCWRAPEVGPPPSAPPPLPRPHLSNKSNTHCWVPEHSLHPQLTPITCICFQLPENSSL